LVEAPLLELSAPDAPLPPVLELLPPRAPPLPELLPADVPPVELKPPSTPSLPPSGALPSATPASDRSLAPGPSNFHQLRLNRSPLPPVKRRNTSCTPVAPVTGHDDSVFQVCAPPVPVTAQAPMLELVRLSKCSSMLPPLVLEATLAENKFAPVPKSTLFTFM
jgi:hypothetical protein